MKANATFFLAQHPNQHQQLIAQGACVRHLGRTNEKQAFAITTISFKWCIMYPTALAIDAGKSSDV